MRTVQPFFVISSHEVLPGPAWDCRIPAAQWYESAVFARARCVDLAFWTERRFSPISCRVTFEHAKYTKGFQYDASFEFLPSMFPWLQGTAGWTHLGGVVKVRRSHV